MIASVPPGMAVFGTVFAVSPKPWVRGSEGTADRLQLQLDLLNRTHHPAPYRKPFIRIASDGTILLAIENVERTQENADQNSLSWAWQIARQAGLSEHDWEISVFESGQVTPHRVD